MKESLQSQHNLTLEDLVKTHTKHPTREMLDGIACARDIIGEFQLSKNLGIKGRDQVLFHAYIAERIIKTKIYDLDWVTHSPEFDFSKNDIIRHDRMQANLQSSLNDLQAKSKEIIDEHYADTKNRFRARTIELAANELIARSSVLNEDNFQTEIIVSDVLVKNWLPKWKKELTIKSGGARQKFLRYKVS